MVYNVPQTPMGTEPSTPRGNAGFSFLWAAGYILLTNQ